MPGKNPTPPEDKKADSFLVRLSVVLLCFACLATLAATLNLPNPDKGQSKEHRELLESIWGFSVLGWLAYLVIIYLAGRSEEVFTGFKRLCESWFPASFSFFAFTPLVFGMCVWLFGWFAWRIPDGIIWVVKLFRA
jgi:hypothetical protein